MNQPATEERDLSFAPVVNPSPAVLSSEQIRFYNEQGYLQPFDIYNELESERNRTYFEYILAELRVHDANKSSYAINGYHTRCEGIYDIAMDRRIVDIVQDIVGPNVICWGTHYFAKMPHDPKSVPWHQDASYWPLSPARTVTVWLAIDDADEGNSAMQFIPGTHDKGPLKWKRTEQDAVLDQEIVDIEQWGKPFTNSLKAGQISIHADMLAHGSQPNPSSRRRCGLTLRYCPPIVRSINPAWSSNAILCRGEDPYGHWTYKGRPCGNDLSIRHRPKAIGGN